MVSQAEIDELIQEWIEIMEMADNLVKFLIVEKWHCRRLAGWTFEESMLDILAHV